MKRIKALSILLAVSICALTEFLPFPQVSCQAGSEQVTAFFSATPVLPAQLSDRNVWKDYDTTVFRSADRGGAVDFYAKYNPAEANIYAAFYVQSEQTYSSMDYVALYLDMGNDQGQGLNDNDYRFIVQRDGTYRSNRGSATLGSWDLFTQYPGSWSASYISDPSGWGALIIIRATAITDSSMMRIGLVQLDYPSGAIGKFPSGLADSNPSTWASLLFTYTRVVFASTPGVSPIIVDNRTYSAEEMPRAFNWTREQTHSFAIPETNITTPGARYIFNRWSDGSNLTERSFTLTKAVNFTAEFATEYLLTVSSQYGQPKGAGWYPKDDNATFSISPIEDHGNGTRRLFTSWAGDTTISNASASMVMDSPKNVVAIWQTQYYLAINASGGNVTGEGWYFDGTIATAEAPSPFTTIANQSRLVFTRWSGDFISNFSIVSVPMDRPHNLTAEWRTEYYLALDPGGGEVTGEAWYEAGAEVTLNATSPCKVMPGESRLTFKDWTGGINASSPTARVIMDSHKAIKANWMTQWYLTIEPAGGVVDQVSQWVDNGTSLVIKATSPCREEAKQMRLVFSGWKEASNATSLSATIPMDGPKALNATWKTQYYLTVVSQYGNPQGEAWYDAGVNANFDVTSPVGLLIQQVFQGWTGSSTANTASSTLRMDAPKSVTALWGTDYMQLLFLIIIVAVVVVAVLMIRVRRTVRWE